ncbi:hypothetical protein niasHT_018533 [Heterodera trifolii]|uniref:Integrase catalytic domain-containing protein n=1 Tax=Heterodera trifolii TaxID=157864 RepID=A0ABD2L5Z0_9BILA
MQTKTATTATTRMQKCRPKKRELLIEKVLDELYKDTRSNAAFTSVEPLLIEARRQHPGRGISRAEVRRYLARQRVYTLHRRAVRRFRRLPTLASGLHTDWQADLADFTALKRHNRGHAYLLVCADTLSRQLFVEPVKSKRSSDIVQAFEKIFRRVGYMPWKLMTDQGKEFTAAPVQRFLADQEVQHHCMHTSPQWHAGIAERAIRSIKERLYRYFTHRGAKCWTGVIQHIVTALNGSPNRALFGLRPNDINFGNAERVRRNQLERLDAGQQQRQSPRARLPFRVGDRVRIEKHKHVFKKGYLPRFTDELFTVAEVRTSRLPITYKLRDDDGELLTGWFYAQDLCLVLKPPPPLRSKRDEPIADKAGAADSATVGPVHDIELGFRPHQSYNKPSKWYGFTNTNETTSSSSSFYIVLPSNTQVEGNRTNSFRVRLPRKLQFGSQWSVGLAVLLYPHSWPSLGTTEEQFVRVEWQTGEQVRIPVPASNVRNPTQLLNSLHHALGEGSEELASRLRQIQLSYHQLTGEAETSAKKEVERLLSLEQQQQQPRNQTKRIEEEKQQQQQKSDEMSQQQQQQNEQKEEWKRTQFNTHYRRTLDTLVAERMEEAERNLLNKHLPLGLELWVQSYRKARLSCRFSFDVEQQRFRLQIDPVRIKQVEMSEQLAYILGFHTRHLSAPMSVARYQPDMKGGVSSFYVYAPGLIEPVIIGDVCVPVLRMVCIRSAQPDDMVEEAYTAVQYHQLITKEIAEIFIEIRTPTGALMPFQYGTCTLTLHFRKTPYF